MSIFIRCIFFVFFLSPASGYVRHAFGSMAAVSRRQRLGGVLLQWSARAFQLSLPGGEMYRRDRSADRGLPCHLQPPVDSETLRGLEAGPSLILKRELLRRQK